MQAQFIGSQCMFDTVNVRMLDHVPINELNHRHYITKLTLYLDVIEILDNHHYIIKTITLLGGQ